MRSRFDEQLRELNKEMIDMGRMIVQSIAVAIEALTDKDDILAKESWSVMIRLIMHRKKLRISVLIF